MLRALARDPRGSGENRQLLQLQKANNSRQESPSELPAAEGLEDHEGRARLSGSHGALMFGKDEARAPGVENVRWNVHGPGRGPLNLYRASAWRPLSNAAEISAIFKGGGLPKNSPGQEPARNP